MSFLVQWDYFEMGAKMFGKQNADISAMIHVLSMLLFIVGCHEDMIVFLQQRESN
jgi:isoprenylcysteine carboxyl methyltransferase (ICMT) family protein YpbQ